jgi:O-antigen/teichoic acid export membrane protein
MTTYLASVGEEAFEIAVALLVLVMVEWRYGHQGLGVYAYLTACLFAARFIANYGVAQFIAREVAACNDNPRQQEGIIITGFQTLTLTGLAMGALVLATAYFDTGQTRIEERAWGYVIIAMIVPLANLNILGVSILHGMGRHAQAVRLRLLRYGMILVGIFALSSFGISPSLLLVAVLAADAILTRLVRRQLPPLPLLNLFIGRSRITDTLKQGQAYLFSDDGLALLLNIDLFVLGFFVSAWDLGVYAQAAVLVRMFFIVPAAARPIFKQHYTTMVSRGDSAELSSLVRRRVIVLFCVHAVLALLVLLYFPAVLNLFFSRLGETTRAYDIFAMVVPGLIFYSTVCAQESLLEAIGAAECLKRMTLLVSAVNLVLTVYFVPMAGTKGAAAATMMTMLIYFAVFGKGIPLPYRISKYTFIIGGLVVYLVLVALKEFGAAAINFWLGPAIVAILFYLIGLFGVDGKSDLAVTTKPRPCGSDGMR